MGARVCARGSTAFSIQYSCLSGTGGVDGERGDEGRIAKKKRESKKRAISVLPTSRTVLLTPTRVTEPGYDRAGGGGIVKRKRARFVSPTGYCTVLYVERATQAASQPARYRYRYRRKRGK